MLFKFSKKIVTKEWDKLLLPFFSILLTGLVVTTSFLLINSARDFITTKNKEFLGGDFSFESSRKYDLETLLKSLSPETGSGLSISEQITFSGLIQALNKEKGTSDKNTGANFKIIDKNYPLYGKIQLISGDYKFPKATEVFLDENLSRSLDLVTGEEVLFNNATFSVAGIVKTTPESLIGGFSFLGTILMSKDGLEKSQADLSLFRKEYIAKIKTKNRINKLEMEGLQISAKQSKVRGRFDGETQGGISFGLDIVERFLIVTILVISILSLVNIYASVNYLSQRLRRSFAVLIALGLNIKSIYKILFLINGFIIFLGTFFGIILGFYISKYIEKIAEANFTLPMFLKTDFSELFLIFVVIFVTSIFATLPAINRLREITPKELLSHGQSEESKNTARKIASDVVLGILPITGLAIYFLNSFYFGLLVMAGIVIVYAALMFFYYHFVSLAYNFRQRFPFSLKLIVAQKKFDGFFGLITFASLFVALASVYNLSVLRTSVEDYLKSDLGKTLPSTYVLDVQNSQQKRLLENFPEISLFPNVRARISEIDGLDIQKASQDKSSNLDRELGREFNLTYRDYLLPSEKVVEGKFYEQKVGEVSLEKTFAKRANIKMNSDIKFNIQGFTVSAKVTSIREADTRSGYPFFYFILPKETLEQYPKTFFGYANISNESQTKLKNYLTNSAPNVSVIDTGAITKIGTELIDILLSIILVITIPPIILSSMLIVTILSSLSKDRKRDGARLMALGKENKYVRNFYILESGSTVVLASSFAYIFAILLANFAIVQYLKIKKIIYFDSVSFYIFISILFGISLVSVYLWRKGGRSLKEYLNYEENN